MFSSATSIAMAALAATATLVKADESAFIMRSMTPIAVARIDPIVNPGEIASHVHTLFGASNLRDVLNTPEEQQRAACTSVVVDKDKSNYWAPTLYYIRKDGTYEGMVTGARAYYFTSPGVQPYPPGMRIVAGTAMSRDRSDVRSRGIVHEVGRVLNGPYLPNGTTHKDPPGAIKTGTHFPSCGWANGSLDSWDHFSHLTWPISTGGHKIWQNPRTSMCPESHPIKYPVIFFEVGYYPSEEQKAEWGSLPENLIYSNGDTLGTSFHADFVNGWEHNALKHATEHCGGVSEAIEGCAAFNGAIDVVKMANCRIQGMIPDEEVGYVKGLKELPGCNPKWTADMGDDKPMNCPNRAPDPGWTAPNALWNAKIREGTLPMAVQVDPMVEANFTQMDPVAGHKESYLSAWGEDQWGRYTKFLNKNAIQIGTAQDIADNLNMDTAVFKRPQVIGMEDTSAYTEINPPYQVPESAWRTLNVEQGVPTHLPGDNVHNAPAGPPLPGAPTEAVATGTASGANASATPPPAGDAVVPDVPAMNGTETEGDLEDDNLLPGTDEPANAPTGAPSEAGAEASAAPSASASGASASASESSAAPSASAGGEAPGGAHNLVAGGGELEAAPSGTESASAAAGSASTSSAAGAGGKKKCNKRRRRSRLH